MKYYAIGDIHGRFDLMERLLNQIYAYHAKNYKTDPATIVFLGDYIDRGPDSKKVIDKLRSLVDNEVFKYIFLKGNHEDMMLTYYKQKNNDHFYHWQRNGGVETLESFGNDIPKDYINWLETNLKLVYNTPNYLFVHAGLQPGIDIEEQITNPYAEETLLWIRHEFLRSDYDWGKRIIHGHTPGRNVEIKHNRINLDTGAFYYGKLSAVALDFAKEPVIIDVSEFDV